VLGLALVLARGRPAALLPSPLSGFGLVVRGPYGGSVWQGVIPISFLRRFARPGDVYLPPGFSRRRRYPVLYLLHGMPGSPRAYVDTLRIATVADRLIDNGSVRPFIAVMPVAGAPHYDGEWTGPWEAYVVRNVLPWTDAHLPTLRRRADRVLAGLSAGGYGAIDIGLRHPNLFGTLESWSGYFHPLHDGTLRQLASAALRNYDPTLLVQQNVRRLRTTSTRFFLSSGTTHDRWTAAQTQAFAHELQQLGLAHQLWLAPGGHDGRTWRAQLPAALTYALPTRQPPNQPPRRAYTHAQHRPPLTHESRNPEQPPERHDPEPPGRELARGLTIPPNHCWLHNQRLAPQEEQDHAESEQHHPDDCGSGG
jgi:enterochelin esterase-like enzyme